MNLPEYQWVRFKETPLKMVIGQVRFTIIPRFKQEGFTADFQEAVYSEYPRVSREQTVAYQLSPTGIDANPGESVWRFSTRDNQWSVIIGESAISLETRQYSSMVNFLERFKYLLEIANETLGIKDRLRLGLRYINEIRYPQAKSLSDWRLLLNPEFVGFDAPELLGGQVKHTLQEIQIERLNGTLAVRHGLLEGAVVATQETPKERHFYLIDLDYYDMQEYDLDIPVSIGQMQEYNDVMYRFFRWTLGEKLYSFLEPRYD
ncbi:MAG: TIGR04255 family protein [Chloroflexota bacterium]|nr:TIGR04255 family protein [Chloroflexota bacterium]